MMGEQEENRASHKLYARNHESIRQYYQVLLDTPFQDSDSKLNPGVIEEFSTKMAEQVLGITESIKKYEEGDPKPMILSAAMRKIFVLLRTLKNQLLEARPNAGPTLARTFGEAMKEIGSCSLDFLECAIGYGPYAQEPSTGWQRLPDLAAKVKEVCEAFLEMPMTNSMAIQESLEQVVNAVEGALHEIQNKDDAEAGASSTSNAEGKQDEAIVKEAAIRVVTNAIRLVEQMISNVMIWNDRYRPGRIMSMESLLKKFIDLGDRIKQISNNLSPLRNVSDILNHLDWMKDFADYLESEPSASGFALKTTTTLKGSIQDLKSVLENPTSPAQVGDAREVVYRESLKIVCFKIAKHAVLIGLLHQAEDVSARMLKECMSNIFDLVKDVQWNAHRAQSKAGRFLSRVISESANEFTGCALHLLRCTVGHGPDGDENKVTTLVLKVLEVYEYGVTRVPLTNAAVIGYTLECQKRAIGAILYVYESFNKFMLANPECNYERNEKRISLAGMRVVYGTVPVIEELSRAVKEWNDSDLSESTITGMETLAETTSLLLSGIKNMRCHLVPPMEVSKALEGLARMNESVTGMQEILGIHSWYASEEFVRKSVTGMCSEETDAAQKKGGAFKWGSAHITPDKKSERLIKPLLALSPKEEEEPWWRSKLMNDIILNAALEGVLELIYALTKRYGFKRTEVAVTARYKMRLGGPNNFPHILKKKKASQEAREMKPVPYMLLLNEIKEKRRAWETRFGWLIQPTKGPSIPYQSRREGGGGSMSKLINFRTVPYQSRQRWVGGGVMSFGDLTQKKPMPRTEPAWLKALEQSLSFGPAPD